MNGRTITFTLAECEMLLNALSVARDEGNKLLAALVKGQYDPQIIRDQSEYLMEIDMLSRKIMDRL